MQLDLPLKFLAKCLAWKFLQQVFGTPANLLLMEVRRLKLYLYLPLGFLDFFDQLISFFFGIFGSDLSDFSDYMINGTRAPRFHGTKESHLKI